MKKRILALLVLTVLLVGCTGPAHAQDAAQPASPAEPTEAPQPEPETEGFPNAVDLYFPGNPTTGYIWSAEISDPAIVELDEQYFAPDTEPGWVGAGGTQWYRIRGASEGITSVTFHYGRPWEDTAITTYVYRVQVNARGDVLIWGVEVDPKNTDA